MRRFTIGLVLLFCVSSAKLANATAIYDFSLPETGAQPVNLVSPFHIELTFPDLLPAGRVSIFGLLTSPVVTSLSFEEPGFVPAFSTFDLTIEPTSTLVGFNLFPALLVTPGTSSNFVFNRTPLTTGTFSSVSGNVVSGQFPLFGLLHQPVGTLTVTSVPEPSSLVLLGSGVLCLAWRRLGKGRSES